VEEELDNLRKFSRYSWVPELLHQEIIDGRIHKIDIVLGTNEGNEFINLTSGRIQRPIGKGEAVVISWAKFRSGTVASNNLNDVSEYCLKNGVGLISTDYILCLAHQRKLIDENEGNTIWALMTNKKRKLPPYNFSEAYRRFLNNLPR
jgi:hypothetical protein